MTKELRYWVKIRFKGSMMLRKSTPDLIEKVATLKEAQSYKSMVDDTVLKAEIVDRVNGSIIETWK
jgi:hypothetical protein